jgi:hypothetical protein
MLQEIKIKKFSFLKMTFDDNATNSDASYSPSVNDSVGSFRSSVLESEIRPLSSFFDMFLKERIDNNGMLTSLVKIQTDPER